MSDYLRNWGVMRILRLLLSIVIIIQGIQLGEWMLVGMGGLFSLMPLFNISCCGTSACNISTTKDNKKEDDITYEEVR